MSGSMLICAFRLLRLRFMVRLPGCQLFLKTPFFAQITSRKQLFTRKSAEIASISVFLGEYLTKVAAHNNQFLESSLFINHEYSINHTRLHNACYDINALTNEEA